MADAPLVRLPDRASSPWRALQWRVVIGIGLLALVVGLVYFLASVAVFAWAESTARTRATLELA